MQERKGGCSCAVSRADRGSEGTDESQPRGAACVVLSIAAAFPAALEERSQKKKYTKKKTMRCPQCCPGRGVSPARCWGALCLLPSPPPASCCAPCGEAAWGLQHLPPVGRAARRGAAPAAHGLHPLVLCSAGCALGSIPAGAGARKGARWAGGELKMLLGAVSGRMEAAVVWRGCGRAGRER